jgi:hypothetical protein
VVEGLGIVDSRNLPEGVASRACDAPAGLYRRFLSATRRIL